MSENTGQPRNTGLFGADQIGPLLRGPTVHVSLYSIFDEVAIDVKRNLL